jgi:hypothetical protein
MFDEGIDGEQQMFFALKTSIHDGQQVPFVTLWRLDEVIRMTGFPGIVVPRCTYWPIARVGTVVMLCYDVRLGCELVLIFITNITTLPCVYGYLVLEQIFKHVGFIAYGVFITRLGLDGDW